MEKRQEIIRWILKHNALWGHPYTYHDIVTDSWKWNENKLQELNVQSLMGVKYAIERQK